MSKRYDPNNSPSQEVVRGDLVRVNRTRQLGVVTDIKDDIFHIELIPSGYEGLIHSEFERESEARISTAHHQVANEIRKGVWLPERPHHGNC